MGKRKMTVTATELSRRTGELLRLVEHGAIITVMDAKHDRVRAVIMPVEDTGKART